MICSQALRPRIFYHKNGEIGEDKKDWETMKMQTWRRAHEKETDGATLVITTRELQKIHTEIHIKNPNIKKWEKKESNQRTYLRGRTRACSKGITRSEMRGFHSQVDKQVLL